MSSARGVRGDGDRDGCQQRLRGARRAPPAGVAPPRGAQQGGGRVAIHGPRRSKRSSHRPRGDGRRVRAVRVREVRRAQRRDRGHEGAGGEDVVHDDRPCRASYLGSVRRRTLRRSRSARRAQPRLPLDFVAAPRTMLRSWMPASIVPAATAACISDRLPGKTARAVSGSMRSPTSI